MAGTCRYLFAYGTLMSTAGGIMGRAQRQRLDREATPPVQAATLRGRLYDLGRYPGLIEPEGCEEIVHGEVRELAQPDLTLAWLDAYEGIVPGQHPHNEYERVERQVTLATGGTLSAWVYLYRQPADGVATILATIPGGRWAPKD